MCVAATHHDCRRRDCSATSVTCLIFMTRTTARSKACRQVHRLHSTAAAAMTTGRTAPHVKVRMPLCVCLSIECTDAIHSRKKFQEFLRFCRRLVMFCFFRIFLCYDLVHRLEVTVRKVYSIPVVQRVDILLYWMSNCRVLWCWLQCLATWRSSVASRPTDSLSCWNTWISHYFFYHRIYRPQLSVFRTVRVASSLSWFSMWYVGFYIWYSDRGLVILAGLCAIIYGQVMQCTIVHLSSNNSMYRNNVCAFFPITRS